MKKKLNEEERYIRLCKWRDRLTVALAIYSAVAGTLAIILKVAR